MFARIAHFRRLSLVAIAVVAVPLSLYFFSQRQVVAHRQRVRDWISGRSVHNRQAKPRVVQMHTDGPPSWIERLLAGESPRTLLQPASTGVSSGRCRYMETQLEFLQVPRDIAETTKCPMANRQERVADDRRIERLSSERGRTMLGRLDCQL